MEDSQGVGSIPPADISTSPASGNRGGCDLQLERPPTQPATNLAWPSSPLPVHARPIRSASLQSSTGSGYLTPPLDAFHDDGPYKPAKDDRVSLNMHNPRKRKRKTECSRSNHGGTEQTSEPITSSFEGARNVQTEYISAKNFDAKVNGDFYQKDLPAPSEIPRRKHRRYRRWSELSALPPHTTFVEHFSWQSQHSSTNIFPGSQHEMAKQITSDSPKRIRNNLARISQALAARKYRRWSSVEPGPLPLPTHSTTIAIRDYRPKSEYDYLPGQHGAHHGLSKQLGISAHPKQSVPVSYRVRQRPGVESKRPLLRHIETPATITLRRASGITAPEEATTAAEGASCQDNDAHSASTQVLKRKITRLMHHLPSYSGIAETAITHADVHVAPLILARTLSCEGLESSVSRLRRTSAVQIRARGSVHEVIWQDKFSSSSASSASQESPRSNRQLKWTQSEPSERVYFTNPPLDMERDPKRKCSFIKNEFCPKSSFVGDESTAEAQTHVIKPPHIIQKLSEWTWDREPKLNHGIGGAISCLQSNRTDSAVQDDDKSTVCPFLEDQGKNPEGHPEEPSARPSCCAFDSRTCLQASCTSQVGCTTTDQCTGVLVPLTQIDRTPARTARQHALSVLPGSQRRHSVREPMREKLGWYSTCTRPRIGDNLVAGSAIGSSSRVRRATRPYQGSSSRRPSDISPNHIGGLCAGHLMARRTTEPAVSPANWLTGIRLPCNSPSVQEVPLAGTNNSAGTEKSNGNWAFASGFHWIA